MRLSIGRSEFRTLQAQTRGWTISALGHLGVRLELDGETIDVVADTAAVHLPALVDGTLVTACLVRRGTSAGTPWIALALHPAPDRPTSWYGRRAAGKPPMYAQPCAAAPAQEPSR